MVRHSKYDPIDRVEYLDLYYAATQIRDEYKRRAAMLLLLLTGRLGLRIGEAMHCHRGWIDWYRGIIRIPQFEPCRCKYCWKRAKANCGDSDDEEQDDAAYQRKDPATDNDGDDDPDPEEIREHLLNNRFQPKSEMGSRPVAFNWSHRISAAITDFYRDYEVLDENYKWCERLLKRILRKSEFFEPGEVVWHALRSTAQTFWMNTNLNPFENKQLGGWARSSDMARYEGTAPVWLSNEMRVAVGKDRIDYDEFDFVALDPRPFEGEDFDPREYDPTDMINPYRKGPKHNPRTPWDNPPAEPVEYQEFEVDIPIGEQPDPQFRHVIKERIQKQRDGELDAPVNDPWEVVPDFGPDEGYEMQSDISDFD